MDYEYFDHTADIGLKAYGHDLPELFRNAAKGLFGIMFETTSSREERTLDVKLDTQEENYEQLLVDWLNELLYLLETEGLVLTGFDIKRLDARGLEAEVAGSTLDPSVHRYKTEVKSATYHMLEIGREKDLYFGRVLFDL